jgi:hypothetical protein
MDAGRLWQCSWWGVGIFGAQSRRIWTWKCRRSFGRVVPFDGESTLQQGCPVKGDSVELGKCVEEMIDVLFANILDAKGINNQGEYDVARVVAPKTESAQRWVVVMPARCLVVSCWLVMISACLSPYMPFWISMLIHLSDVTISHKLYWSMISWGMVEIWRRMYSLYAHGRVEVEVFDVANRESGIES